MKNEEKKEITPPQTKITVFANGPLRVHGSLEVTDKDGNIVIKEKGASFCRCGASSNQPFCDGQHKKIGFED